LVTYQNYTKMHGQKNIKLTANILFCNSVWTARFKILESIWFTTCFEQLRAHPQEDNCSLGYNHSVIVAVRYAGMTCIPDGHYYRVIIPDVLIQLSSWGWAHSCSKHVEDSNKHIIEEIVHQVCYLPELYEDAQSEKCKKLETNIHNHIEQEITYLLHFRYTHENPYL